MSYREWLVGTVVSTRMLTPTAKAILLDVPGWAGSAAGQHVDVRLTADDGYQAVRAYSLASTGAEPRVELAVDLIPDGEVSPYLVHELRKGDQLEFRGPLGRWFVWKPAETRPVQLLAGGSGVVPLLAMVRAHAASGSTSLFRMLYSVRGPEDVFYPDELRDAAGPHFSVDFVFTRRAPQGHPTPPGRITGDLVAALAFSPAEAPAIFVCGPNGFVGAASDLLISLGHDPATIKTERFGGD